MDGTFYAIGSRFSYYTSDYVFNYVTIDPVEVMASSGGSGVEERLPGTVLNDIKQMSMPYGLYVNPYTGYIYGTDAASFASSGTLYQWSPEGQLLGTHKVYINPAHFLALPPDGQHYSGIETIDHSPLTIDHSAGAWFSLDGRCLSGKPMQKGIYINNGKKTVIK